PAVNAFVSSPLNVAGVARGNWYFEASFPIEVVDANGKRLGLGIAEAQGDWMTEDFVPFESVIEFSAVPTTQTGKVILHKDNPSGLPEHDARVEIPVRFSDAVSRDRDI